MALVSIITPSYNSALLIVSTIQSVISQTFTDWEMIVVDDCSKDNSVEVIQSFVDCESRIKLIKLTENSGAAVARNTAIEAAQGRFIAFLDSDDLWDSQKLEKQINFMINENVAFSYTAYMKINEEGVPFQAMKVPSKVSYRNLLKTCVIGCLTVVYDTKYVGKVYMPENIKREDFATWLRLLKCVDYAYALPEVLASYRVYPDQSSSNKASMALESWRLYRNVEQLNIFKATYYFSQYAIRGLLRAKVPRIASVIGIL
ncbi:glycosyltransferase family 2 protein [Psychrobacter faecalis]|uniref:glycosyltransferase family 2 protein n=1 Tax=Psychrobacter faecalis TaxID=180588 RepID=UPI0028AC29C2|nr:glycosyltransferase family 2 protein [Psychrobacter faecalis]